MSLLNLGDWIREERTLARADRISSIVRGLLTEKEVELYASGRLITLRRLSARLRRGR